MSGTSLDAVDAAMILTDGERVIEFGPTAERTYTDQERTILADSVGAARNWNWEGAEPVSCFQRACEVLTSTHEAAFRDILRQCDGGSKPQVVGIHGQTVLHRAPGSSMPGRTLQLLDQKNIAERFGLPIVFDFRTDDVAAGGQGAPLAPVYHQALCADRNKPVAVLNLGGVANLTLVSDTATLQGFDCGPANGPVDEWVERHKQGRYDRDGGFARSGSIDEARIAAWLNSDWFDQPLPKSLDRYDYNADLAEGLNFADGCATLTAFSAAAVAKGVSAFSESVREVIVCGGGRHNPFLMEQLEARCSVPILTAEDAGWRGDSIEAEAFALLAVRHLRNLPISFPGTTGVRAPMTGGRTQYPVTVG